MSDYHQPVLIEKTAEFLITRRAGCIVDLTCGGGNHLRFLADHLGSDAVLIGIDRDPEAVAETERILQDVKQTVHVISSSFEKIDRIVKKLGIEEVNGFIMDLGVSSHQIDSPQRGFSYIHDGPLDMRMGPEDDRTAADVVNEYSYDQLKIIFKQYGEEKRAAAVAEAICRRRRRESISSTGDLVETISPVLSPKNRNASLSRIFQSLRIYLNAELDQLSNTLPKLVDLLATGGRICVLSYHSLEDRIVKEFFREREKGCICPPKMPVCSCGHKPELKILTKKVVRPSQDEMDRNTRARSAKLRAAEKIA